MKPNFYVITAGILALGHFLLSRFDVVNYKQSLILFIVVVVISLFGMYTAWEEI